MGLGRCFGYYNHLRRHSSLGRQTPATVYGLETLPADEKLVALPARGDRIGTPVLAVAGAGGGTGRPRIARAAVASAALRFASATAAGTLPMRTVPPYSTRKSVQRMGTSQPALTLTMYRKRNARTTHELPQTRKRDADGH